MSAHIGIALAFVAMLSWGIGDFFIQKSVRKVGDWEALFAVTLFGALVLSPFAYKNVPALFSDGNALFIIGVLCVILFLAAILDFEALREGKLAVIEPIWSFEVPVAALLAFFILGERLGIVQIFLIVILLIGLALVSVKNKFEFRRLLFEKGAMIAALGGVLMGAANFFMGWSSRLSDPVMANFVSDSFIAFVSLLVLIFRGNFFHSVRDIMANPSVLLPMSVADKAAWLAFAFAMSVAPIGVATALSESYIIIAVILGLFINREKTRRHQKFGLAIALAAAIVLASITN